MRRILILILAGAALAGSIIPIMVGGAPSDPVGGVEYDAVADRIRLLAVPFAAAGCFLGIAAMLLELVWRRWAFALPCAVLACAGSALAWFYLLRAF